jgi:hypothetical protein
MKSINLILAIQLITNKTMKQVSQIQFEDGSGYNFNYQLVRDNKWYFIDLKDEIELFIDGLNKEH